MSIATRKIDTDVMHRALANQPLIKAQEVFGEEGVTRLKQLLNFLRIQGQFCRVNRKTQLTVFAPIGIHSELDEKRLVQAERILNGKTINGVLDLAAIEIRPDGTAFLWKGNVNSPLQNQTDAIVYSLVQEVEEFRIGEQCLTVDKFLPGAPSQFLLHHFDDLRKALLDYGHSLARHSTCPTLREAWQDPDRRFWFGPGPEHRLRTSLSHYLRCCMRFDDYWVRPEQNIDESHPIDIKLTAQMSTREALIEIKWIGKSRSGDGARFTANYGESRANKGAEQLANYLDNHKRNSPASDTLGYLVVFDCRRHGVKASTKSLTAKQQCHFATREITYNPDYHSTRSDFEKPIRLFLEA